MKIVFSLCCWLSLTAALQSQPLLKYVIYDFDGLDIGQTDLPDGDYNSNDLSHSIAANPLQASDVIGDRVLKLNLSWNSGKGEFGKALMRYLELNVSQDILNFYVYNPLSNSASAEVEVVIQEDDNGNDIFDGASDDQWNYTTQVQRTGGWQLISVPLSSFKDANAGGNGSFDARYTPPGGMLFSVGFVFKRPQPGSSADTYYIDMICFSDGTLPVGAGILDLPHSAGPGSCVLGALGSDPDPSKVPGEISAFLPAGKKLALVNWFVYYSTSGTSANALPGNEVQVLLDNGYTPIITWESMFAEYTRLDPVQPRLNAILNGSFDSYIDDFAAKIKSFNGTVILRIFHEFEGDWYPWSLTENGKDPAVYVSAFRYVVDRFRAAGANNVQWMWCLNAEPKPYAAYNWVVSCYPGDEYVDIVATDIYNHPDLGTPDWKSFRYTMAESYYYLAKYYAHKPIYICEAGSRERNTSEAVASETKGEWICRMSKDIKSYFSKTKALVFFSTIKEHDWRINSSPATLQSFRDCIWSDQFYGGVLDVGKRQGNEGFYVYPNPFADDVWVHSDSPYTGAPASIRITDVNGKTVFAGETQQVSVRIGFQGASCGVYVVEFRRDALIRRQKILKTGTR